MKKTLLQLFGFMLLPIAQTGMATEPLPSVRVGVYAEHGAGGRLIYNYRIVNNSTFTISVIAIGRTQVNDSSTDELVERPLGWNMKSGIPAASSNAPNGWRVSLSNPPESPLHALLVEATSNASKLTAGSTLNKLSVTLNKADANYLKGHVLLTFADGTPEAVVPLEKLDNSPPKLSISLNVGEPNADNGGYIPVNVSFPIKGDNDDRFPEVRLESITANQPLVPDDILDASYGLDDRYFKLQAGHQGRIYKITYSATDGSGNNTIATATLTISQGGTLQKTADQSIQAGKITPVQ